MFGRRTRQLIGGLRRWNNHLAGIVATNLGEVSVRYRRPLWQHKGPRTPSERNGANKRCKRMFFFSFFCARLWHLDRNTGTVIDGAVWSLLNGNQPVLTYLASRWTLINGPRKACCLGTTLNSTLTAWNARRAGCGYVEGGNPAFWVSLLFFFMVRGSLSAPYNYRPVCAVGLTTWFCRRSCLAAPLFLPSLSASPRKPPEEAFRPSAPVIHRLPPDGPIWVVPALKRRAEFKWKMMWLSNCQSRHIRLR